ncbi:MAG TPA: type II secretion system F family protein [Sedimentibacter sp.]|nr:type II secretion system F family protein [Sedimentibacter sp.]HOA20515.1 type II secretion system F family protein [Sedimentibacter sp.]HOG63603.1 type II secretion system F family protein [Sedimentibacter sp.]HPW99201.1 type II secretion system F family protein [Sedimentibacter sp.]
MISYKCNVIDISGNKQRITCAGNSRKDVIDFLKLQEYTVVKINDKKTINLGNISKNVKSKDLAVFCKQTHAMLKAGVTIVSILKILKQQTENRKLRGYIGLMHEELQKGHTFSETLRLRKGAFPETFISMAEAGELSGNFDVIMDRLSIHYEKENKIENKIKSAMTYPIILSIVCIAVVIFLLTSIMPTFVEMYASSGVPLPKLTLVIINIGNLLKNFWFLIVLWIAAVIFITSSILRIHKFRVKKDYLKLQIPLVKNMIIKVAASRFSRTLSTMLGSGASLLGALETVSGVTGNLYICSKILEVKEDVRKGLPLSLLLQNQGVFPPMVYYMIKIGEDSGSLEEVLNKTADFYDEEIETAIHRLTTLLEPVMIVIMAIVIGFIVISMVLPMFEMVNTVQ